MPEPRDAGWERQHLHALFYNEHDGLGLCGCGNPEDAYNLIRDLLNLAPFFKDDNLRKAQALIGSSGAAHIVLGQLDRVGLIEHGGVITGSWLTDKGTYARYLMRRHEWESSAFNMEFPDGVDDEGFPHEGADCTEECWKAPAGLVLDEPGPQFSPGDFVREVADRIEVEAAAVRARMTPAQLAAWDQVAKATEGALLYGGFAPPDRAVVPVDHDRTLNEVVRIGFSRPSVLPDVEERRRQVLDAFGIPPEMRAEWAQIDRDSIRRFLPAPVGCRRHESGTWIHGRPHDCPRWTRR